MSVLDDFVCWIIFIFAYPVQVMLKSYCLRISKISQETSQRSPILLSLQAA